MEGKEVYGISWKLFVRHRARITHPLARQTWPNHVLTLPQPFPNHVPRLSQHCPNQVPTMFGTKLGTGWDMMSQPWGPSGRSGDHGVPGSQVTVSMRQLLPAQATLYLHWASKLLPNLRREGNTDRKDIGVKFYIHDAQYAAPYNHPRDKDLPVDVPMAKEMPMAKKRPKNSQEPQLNLAASLAVRQLTFGCITPKEPTSSAEGTSLANPYGLSPAPTLEFKTVGVDLVLDVARGNNLWLTEDSIPPQNMPTFLW